jgi:DNA-directed RNA polymerase alpha subunit
LKGEKKLIGFKLFDGDKKKPYTKIKLNNKGNYKKQNENIFQTFKINKVNPDHTIRNVNFDYLHIVVFFSMN